MDIFSKCVVYVLTESIPVLKQSKFSDGHSQELE